MAVARVNGRRVPADSRDVCAREYADTLQAVRMRRAQAEAERRRSRKPRPVVVRSCARLLATKAGIPTESPIDVTDHLECVAAVLVAALERETVA